MATIGNILQSDDSSNPEIGNDIRRLADSAEELVRIQTAFLVSFQYLKENLTGKLAATSAGAVRNIKTGKFAPQREFLAQELIKKVSLVTEKPATPTRAAAVESPAATTGATETSFVKKIGTQLSSLLSPSIVDKAKKETQSETPSKTPLQSIDKNVKRIVDIMTDDKKEKEKSRDLEKREKKPGFVGKVQKFLGMKPEKTEKKEEKAGFLSSLGNLAQGIGKAAVGFGIGILAIAGALFIAAKGFQEFAKVQWEDFIKGIGALSALVGSVILLKKMKVDKSMKDVGIGMIAMSAAMFIMAKAIKSFEDIKWEDLGKAALVLAGLVTAVRLLGANAKEMVKVGGGMILMAAALWGLTYSIQALGKLNWDELGTAALVLAGLVAAVRLLGANAQQMIVGTAAMFGLSLALWAIGKALTTFNDIDWKQLGIAAIALGVFTAAVFGLGALIDSAVGGAIFGTGIAGFIALATALGGLGLALKAVSWGMDGLVSNLERMSQLSGDSLKNVASGIKEIGSALLGFGGKSFLAGIANFFGGDGPLEKLQKLATFGADLEKTAASLDKINSALAIKFDNEQLKNQTKQIEQLEKISKTGVGLSVVATNLERIMKSVREQNAIEVSYDQPDQKALVKISPKLSPKEAETGGFLDSLSRGVQRAKEVMTGAGSNVVAPITNNVVTTKGPTNNIVQGMPSSRPTESSWMRWQNKNYVPS